MYKRVKSNTRNKLLALKHHSLITLLCREYFLIKTNGQDLWVRFLGHDPSFTPRTSIMHEEPLENPNEIEFESNIEIHPICTYIPKFMVGSTSTKLYELPKDNSSSSKEDEIEEENLKLPRFLE